MAETAFQIQYRQQWVDGFEQRVSLLRESTTTEAVIKGNTATFLVADSGSATATTRGINGMLTARGDNLSQPAATLVAASGQLFFQLSDAFALRLDTFLRTLIGVANLFEQFDAARALTGVAAAVGLAVVLAHQF